MFPESDLAAPELAPIREALAAVLDGHLPYPALVARPRGELVTANAAFDLFTEGVADHLLRAPINVLRLALHPDGVAPRVINLPEWGRHIVDSLRSRAARTPDPAVDALITELSGYLPAATPGPGHLGFAVPLHLRSDDGELRLITTLTSFATATDVTVAELQLEAFLPADEQTARILRLRASRR
ncbi:MmyB family transcriptional regulator [Nocardia cyriacigeorgica]|uniref:MmyB family transcriptional regulator n=1 Tax=Nocardia cyriacigeorgica TaxID=135487 RepID=UPI002B4AB475|nr:transcriptional regulator [Nocardia cyriacigeorgica]